MTLPKKPDELKTAEKINETEKKVKKAKEVIPMEEAWENIFKLKNTASQLAQLNEVKKALEEGIIGRETYDKDFKRAEALRLYTQLKELKRQDRLDELVANTPKNYILVDTDEKLTEMRRTLEVQPCIGYDTETTGLDTYKDKIVGYCFYAPDDDKAYYVPIRHETQEKQLPIEDVNNVVSYILRRVPVKILHNAQYDMHMTLNEGISITGTWHCTQTRMHQLNVEEPSLQLKVLATKYLNIPSDRYEELFGKGGFEGTPLKYARYYGCNDPKITYQLYMFQEKLFEHSDVTRKIKEAYEKIEQPLIKVVVDMERVGFHLDVEVANENSKWLGAKADTLEKSIKSKLGDINLGSAVQLKPALIKLTGDKTIKSTDKKTLKSMKAQYPVCGEILEWRGHTKLKNDFFDKLPELKKPTGKWHSEMKPRGTKTGRFSSKNFNIQQIHKDVRKAFVAPEGLLILSADFSGQENRLLGHICQDKVMIDGWKKGIDFYSLVASMTFSIPYEECGDGSKWRSLAKVIVLAVTYGISEVELGFTILNATLENGSKVPTKDEAKKKGAQTIKDFLSRFNEIEPWMKRTRAFAHSKGYISTMYGNVRPLRKPKQVKHEGILTPWEALPHWKKRSILGSIDRKAVNTVIQGSAAEQTKLVMLQADKFCTWKRSKGREFYLLSSVHDELLFYVPEDITQEERDWIEKIMTQTVTLQNVEVKTDIAIGKNWKDMISWDEFIENGKKIA